jgi:hypothetical protein
MNIKKRIFLGNGNNSMAECYHLHKRMEEAFDILCGIQQPPRPCDPEGSYKEYKNECEEGEEEIHRITKEIVRGLLGKGYKIVRDKSTEGN